MRSDMIMKSHQLQNLMEPAVVESKELNQTPKNPMFMLVSYENDNITTTSGNNKKLLIVKVKQTFTLMKAVKFAY